MCRKKSPYSLACVLEQVENKVAYSAYKFAYFLNFLFEFFNLQVLVQTLGVNFKGMLKMTSVFQKENEACFQL